MLIYENKEKKMRENAGPWKLDCSFRNYFTTLWYYYYNLIAPSDVGKEDLATIEEDFNLKELFEGTQCEFWRVFAGKNELCDYSIPVLFFRLFFVHRVYFVMKIEYIPFLNHVWIFQGVPEVYAPHDLMHDPSIRVLQEAPRKPPGSLHRGSYYNEWGFLLLLSL